jgi:RND family efflux transporter MFP subunit
MKRSRFAVAGAVLLGVLGACTRPPPPVAPQAPPDVRVVSPRSQTVTDYQDFTGRAKASDTVDIKPRVTGYVEKIHFTEGGEVTAGQPLFDLDPGLYGTELARAEAAEVQAKATVVQERAKVQQASAALATATKDYDRVKNLPSASATERVLAEGNWEAAKAGLEVARAGEKVADAAVVVAERQVAQAAKNVAYTRITATKAGRIGRHLLDKDALAKADETVLATVVTTDPMHVYFDVDDRTDLRLKRLTGSVVGSKVKIGLPDQEGFPDADKGGFVGTVTFRDTQLTATTGTITLRADVPNPAGLLTPNLFVRVRLPVGEAKPCVLVPEEAVGTDQGLKYVGVVTAKDEAEYRPVRVGLQVGTDVVVEPMPGKANSGVAEGERVIVEGVQRVRRGMKVTVRSGQ